jgi:hypothetical protein
MVNFTNAELINRDMVLRVLYGEASGNAVEVHGAISKS